MLICHLYIFFGDVSVKVFGPFFIRFFVFLLVSFKSSLLTLCNNSSSDVSFANMFSYSVACPLILFKKKVLYWYTKLEPTVGEGSSPLTKSVLGKSFSSP